MTDTLIYVCFILIFFILVLFCILLHLKDLLWREKELNTWL